MPGKRHYFISAVAIGLVVGVLALAVLRYVETGRTRKQSTYAALANSLHLASVVRSNQTAGITKALTIENELLRQDPSIRRVFFVKKGVKVKALNISKPAKFVVDFGRLEGIEGEEEKLVTLCARLDQHFLAGGKIDDLQMRALSWPRAEDESLIVGAFPVLVDSEFVGVAGVEMRATRPASHQADKGALILGLFLVVFSAGMAFLRRPRLSFALAGIAVLSAALVMTSMVNRERVNELTLQRDAVTTRVVNRVAPANPGALDHLDKVWRATFKQAPDGLVIASADDRGEKWSGAVVCTETAASVGSLVLGDTYPVMVVLAVLLIVGFLLLEGAAAVAMGLGRMPGVYAYVAPAMVVMIVLVLVPFVMGVGLGFFNMDNEFVGLDNFHDILIPSAASDTNFYFTMGFTIFWTVCNVVLHVSIGLFMALILVSPKVRFKGLFRVLLVVPWAVPNYITALIWKWMFTSQVGAVNLVLEAIGVEPVSWFGPSFWTNYFTVLVTNAWLGFPFMMVVCMGALQSIPNELYEAADIDGASRWQKFRNITLPLLKPALFPAIILGTIWTFNQFNIIYLVTRGNPDNKTNILITEAYRFFQELNQYGVAAAYCVLIFVILLMYTLITNKVTRATEGAFE